MDHKKAYLSSLLTSLIIGFSFLFVKIGQNYVSPNDLLAHRFTFAFLAMLIYLKIADIKISLRWHDIKHLAPIALFYPILFFAFQAYGLVYASSAQAGIIQATVPVLTLIGARLYLKERSQPLQRLGVLISVAGMILLQYINNAVSTFSVIGILLIFLSVLSQTVYQILSKEKTQTYSVINISFIVIFIGMIIFNAISFFSHIRNDTLWLYFSPFTNINYLLIVAYLGILSTFLTSALSIFALSKLSVIQASIFNNLATLITILVGALFLNEPFTWIHASGTLMVLTGVLMVNYFRNDSKS